MNCRVLLIEDDIFLHQLYADYLSRSGLIVTGAYDAQEGLNLLDEYGADCIVLDLMLPAHNGIEVLHELQTHADWATIPVLILSAQKPQQITGIKDQLARCNVKDYLYKPLTNPQLLIQAIKKHTNATV